MKRGRGATICSVRQRRQEKHIRNEETNLADSTGAHTRYGIHSDPSSHSHRNPVSHVLCSGAKRTTKGPSTDGPWTADIVLVANLRRRSDGEKSPR